jgi:mannonate dehydratase
MMQRRNFFKVMGAGSMGALAAGCNPTPNEANNIEVDAPAPKKKVLMKVGCQHGGTSKENLEYLARHGVFNIDAGSPNFIEGVGWDLEDSLAKKEACEKY